MKLSAPIYHLKRKAKRLSRNEGIPLHDALDRIATTEGFSAWSMLAAKAAAATPANRLFPQFRPGDLVLTLGAGDIYKCADELLGLLRAGAPVPAVH